MTMPLELLVFIGAFGLVVGLIGWRIESTDRGKRKLLAEHEARRFARQPWDAARPPNHRNH